MAEVDDVVNRMERREKTFYEKQCRFKRPSALSRDATRMSSKSSANAQLRSCDGDSCVSGTEVSSLPVIPDESVSLHLTDLIEDYDYDMDEGESYTLYLIDNIIIKDDGTRLQCNPKLPIKNIYEQKWYIQ